MSKKNPTPSAGPESAVVNDAAKPSTETSRSWGETTTGPALLTDPGNGQALQPAPVASPNGSTAPRPSRLPQTRKRSKLYRLVLPVGGVALLLVVFLVWFIFFRGPQRQTNLALGQVEYRDLQLKVVERGTLEAIDNHDVKCNVKPGSRTAPKIMWVIDNGTPVEKGDLLVEIDDSTLVEQATNQKIAMDKAESDKINAEQNLPIAESALKQWDEGDYPSTLQDYKGQIQVSDSTYQQQKDRTAWVSRMVKKGYMTVSQEESERSNEEGCRLDLAKKKTQLEVLEKYTNPTNHQKFDNAILIAQGTLKSATQVYQQAKDLYDDLMQQIKECRVLAPSAGIVVYYVPEQTQRGMGTNQSTIAQGEPVNFGQTMVRVPDLGHMQVNIRIHEAFINRMEVKARLDEVSEGGPADKAGLKPGDIITKIGNRPIKSYPALLEALRSHRRDQVKVKVLRGSDELDFDVSLAKPNASPKGSGSGADAAPKSRITDPNALFGAHFQLGLPATVEIDAVPGRVLKGHVKSVASVAAPQDWMSPDVKVYQAYVEIDDPVKDLNLKPGLSANCKMFTEAEVAHVLSVPIQAIVNPLEKGAKPRCFVMTPRGPEPREVELGLSDNVYYEIKDGLNEGDQIVLNPRSLLGDKEKEKKGSREDATGKGQGDKSKGSYAGKKD